MIRAALYLPPYLPVEAHRQTLHQLHISTAEFQRPSEPLSWPLFAYLQGIFGFVVVVVAIRLRLVATSSRHDRVR